MAILDVWKVNSDSLLFQYAQSYYDHFIDDSIEIKTYRMDEFNIDRINSGKALFPLFQQTGIEKYEKAIHRLRNQMKLHPRTIEGGFWHKKIYPHQMWLDGIYMASPFLAQYAKTYCEKELFDDVANQIILMENHSRDPKTGLLYHGWDESHTQPWSDPITGCSPNFWGRSMGWYAMALADVLDYLPCDHPKRPEIVAILNRLCQAITNFQDKKTGLWYQIVDQPEREENYPESSASCMFVYALAKGVRLGYLDNSYLKNALKGYEGILKYFIISDSTGNITIQSGCAVAGLGGEPYRDGSYAYYIHEKVRDNDPKSVGAFILASLEIEHITFDAKQKSE